MPDHPAGNHAPANHEVSTLKPLAISSTQQHWIGRGPWWDMWQFFSSCEWTYYLTESCSTKSSKGRISEDSRWETFSSNAKDLVPQSTKHSGSASPQTTGSNMKKVLAIMIQVHAGCCTSSLGFGLKSSWWKRWAPCRDGLLSSTSKILTTNDDRLSSKPPLRPARHIPSVLRF